MISLMFHNVYVDIFTSLILSSLFLLAEGTISNKTLSTLNFHQKNGIFIYDLNQNNVKTTPKPAKKYRKRSFVLSSSKLKKENGVQYAPIPSSLMEKNVHGTVGEFIEEKLTDQLKKKVPLEPQNISNAESHGPKEPLKTLLSIHDRGFKIPFAETHKVENNDYDYFNNNHKGIANRNEICDVTQIQRRSQTESFESTFNGPQNSVANYDEIKNNEKLLQEAIRKLKMQLALNSFLKLPRVELNIARPHNIAKVLYKAPVKMMLKKK